MKKLFTILLVTVLTGCLPELPKSNTDYKNIIGRPIKIGNIEVAQYDFPKEMNWDDAKEACEALGQGWRLPDEDELELLFQKKNKIGVFAKDLPYWSSTESFAYNNVYVTRQDFNNGDQLRDYKEFKSNVRAVRTF